MYSPDINWQGLYDYFTYLYVPCPETIFKGIFQVPPAHVLELDLDSNDLRFRRYWQLEQAGIEADHVKRDHEDDKDRLRALLADSVRCQMVSDVPLGVFLSGGVDSPILTGLMAKTSPRPVKTFTVIFHGKNLEFYDERDNARAVADKFATEHHEVEVEIGDPMAMLRLVEYFDQPFGNPTFYLMHLISRHTRSEVTVALCGAGGDDLFGGDPRSHAMARGRGLWGWRRGGLNGVRQILGLASDDYRSMSLRRIRQFLDGLDADFARQFVKWTYFLDESQKQFLLRPCPEARSSQGNGFLPSERIVRRYLENSPLEDFGNRVLHLDVQTFLPDNLLEYTDKMSMAVGLEVRVPYLDYRVVEHSFRIPFHDKLRGTRSKVVLKEAFADLLPEANRKAPKKGFNVPLAIWMRDHLDQYFDLYMGRREVEREGILNWEYIQLLRHQHRTRKRDNSYELFSIIMFDVWYRKYILGLDLSAPSLHR
jgi:asparagine synthase (glutamine-hydrolysing)